MSLSAKTSGIADHGRGGQGPQSFRQISTTQLGADGDHRKQVQVNANIGASPNASDAAEEVKKLKLAVSTAPTP